MNWSELVWKFGLGVAFAASLCVVLEGVIRGWRKFEDWRDERLYRRSLHGHAVEHQRASAEGRACSVCGRRFGSTPDFETLGEDQSRDVRVPDRRG